MTPSPQKPFLTFHSASSREFKKKSKKGGKTMMSMMYSRKRVGPRVELSGTPVLAGCSCEDIESKVTECHLLLKKT